MNIDKVYSPKASRIRIITLFFTLLFAIIGNFLFAFINAMKPDEIIVLFLFTLVFFLVYIVCITKKRLMGQIYEGTNYLYFFITIFISYIFVFLSGNLYKYLFPFMLIPMLLRMVYDSGIALAFSIYFTLLYSICFSSSLYTSYAYLIISVITVIIIDYYIIGDFKYKYLVGILIGLSNFIFITLFDYLKDYSVDVNTGLYILISSVIGVLFIIFLFQPIYNLFNKERQYSYETIIDINNPILLDIKKVSLSEYKQAIFTANLSGDCAELIGADKMVCMAGGLYYNAYKINPIADEKKFYDYLNDKCFPPEVIRLLAEHGKDDSKPSNKESAIVHIVNTVLTTIESMLKKGDKNSWNIQLIVYQTLNDYSISGIYDNSGLSMNEFLKIRDLLVKVEYNL